MVSEYAYAVLETNELCEKQNIIDTEIECKVAAMSTSSDDDGIINTTASKWYPRGCYVNGIEEVWFNSHPVGKKTWIAAPICRKGKCIYL